MNTGIVNLLGRSWWRFEPNDHSWFSAAYHKFNLFEGCAWCLLAVLVAVRFSKHRRSRWEVVYCVAFVSFGASDFREAYQLDTWLIAAKLINLIALAVLRSYLIKRFYPASKTY